MPKDKTPKHLRELPLFDGIARSAGKKRAQEFAQSVYEDAMGRAIKVIRERATTPGRHGPVPITIGGLEAEISIRRELTPLAGGHVEVIGPTD